MNATSSSFQSDYIVPSPVDLRLAIHSPSLIEMEIGGYNDVPDWPKMGPSQLIATCLIVAIHTAR
jgi:hypothetical protein